MNIKALLSQAGINSDNAIVIESGILNALELRKSTQVKVIVSEQTYKTFIGNKSFKPDLLTLCIVWTIVDKQWTYQDLLDHSTIIDDVRYITIDFLCNAKTSQLLNGEFSQKDKDDLVLMNTYLDKQGPSTCGCDC
jgi:hypothetical protein